MENKVLAAVNGMQITEADVSEAIASMGQRGQALNNPQGRAMILEQIINRKLFLSSARKDLLEFDPVFKAQLAQVKEELLTKLAISRALENVKITDEEAKRFYDENPDSFRTGETVTASHILVETEEKAQKIRDEIENKEITFADAAKKYSSCPSKENGGELGSFGRGQMVKEFEDAAFNMNAGELSSPVQTQFGWHLITVSSRAEDSTLPFEEMSEQIKEQLLNDKQQKAYVSRINQLKILFPVDRF